MAIYNTVKCIGGKITEPLHDKGVSDHFIYEIDCIVDAASYEPLTLHTAMTNATSAGVDQLPAGVGPNANAFFVGDSEPQAYQGGLVQFTRRFATIPGTWTDPVGSEIYEFPAYFSERAPYVRLSPLREKHTYQAGDTFTLPAVFQTTLSGFPVHFVANAEEIAAGSPATNPSKTAYKASVIAGDYLVIDAHPTPYLGNIYQIVERQILAQ